jgi:acetyltransferase-like isoleucine patch superfamily enzyme
MDTSINVGINITDPAYVRIGNNCALSACTLLGHDGVVRILNTAYNKKLDSVGKIDILDNSFVGHGAIVMPGVTIGPNSIVAAGSVVSRDVPPGVVVGGIPAKTICTTDELVKRIESRTNEYPWKALIEKREGAFDATMEPELKRMRVEYFYGNQNS